MYLIFDTETTGLPKSFSAPYTDTDNWPRMVQLAWQVHDAKGDLVEVHNYIIAPEGYSIPYNAAKIHGITTERAKNSGVALDLVLDIFWKSAQKCTFLVGHNVEFDIMIARSEMYRSSKEYALEDIPSIDTKNVSVDYCALPGGKGGKYKWPTLTELHFALFQEGFDEAHNAAADVEATARCFLELLRISVVPYLSAGLDQEEFRAYVKNNPDTISAIGLDTQPYGESEQNQAEEEKEQGVQSTVSAEDLKQLPFAHLHVHSQFSILQSTTLVQDIANYADEHNLPAAVLTDFENLMASFRFVNACNTVNKKRKEEGKKAIVPIIGCEFNVCKDRLDTTQKDNGYKVVLIAKNKAGFQQLSKLSSLSFVEGYYYVPRIDKALLEEYSQDLIVLTGGYYGMLYQTILNRGAEYAKEELLWWKQAFPDDLYLEIVRHGMDGEDVALSEIKALSRSLNLPIVASNDTFYTNKAEAVAHDNLLCVKEGAYKSTPIGRGKDKRFGLEQEEYYLKTPEEMKRMFADIPEAIENIGPLIAKCEGYQLSRDILLPKFDIPKDFLASLAPDEDSEKAYLRYLTYEGAKNRYSDLNDEVKERIDFELKVINDSGYPGYFLIVQDFTHEARKMGVSVGPGRGSAAGSVVAYCLEITNIDPLEYGLLFERFLNPDRVSMPDIDIDFDDEGRGKIIQYVIDKYGENQVSQIITYGKCGAKSSIKDTGRVLQYPLDETVKLSALLPDNVKLKKTLSAEGEIAKANTDDERRIYDFQQIAKENSVRGDVLRNAKVMEGAVRNTGVHACGIIITPGDLKEYVPLSRGKTMHVTQYDNDLVESAGLLKMDFLGLRTLSIIRKACQLVKQRKGITLDPDEFPLDDAKTFELYQKGETNATFQFESEGMQGHLKELKPDQFEDLIAMNALYRPGPMEYIPSYIDRKFGRQTIEYTLEGTEDVLKETYGITIYQEQVMLLSQKVANFSKGQADMLRKAMGKKKKEILEELRPLFIEGGISNGHKKEDLLQTWNDWEAFASYAFNKSHSACYSLVAYQTGYLKANFPVEFMTAVLSCNSGNITKLSFLMQECKRMGIGIKSPNVNWSKSDFTIDDQDNIVFGMSAVKGVSEKAVEDLIEERQKDGRFLDIYDFIQRVNTRSLNKKNLQSLILAGAFDDFPNVKRSAFFYPPSSGASKHASFLEEWIAFGQYFREIKNRPPDIFGNSMDMSHVKVPVLPQLAEEENVLELLQKEKEVVGVYISAHPLDIYRREITSLHPVPLSTFDIFDGSRDRKPAIEETKDEVDEEGKEDQIAMIKAKQKEALLKQYLNKEVVLVGQVSQAIERIDKKGRPFGIFHLEDYSGAKRILLFGENYAQLKLHLVDGSFIGLRAKLAEKRYNKNEYELSYGSAFFLSDYLDNHVKELRLSVVLDELNQQQILDVKDVLSKYEGTTSVSIEFKERASNDLLQMRLKNIRVRIDSEMLDYLETLTHWSYYLN